MAIAESAFRQTLIWRDNLAKCYRLKIGAITLSHKFPTLDAVNGYLSRIGIEGKVGFGEVASE